MQWSQRGFLSAILVLSALPLFFFAHHLQWSDSELWSLGSARVFVPIPGTLGFDKIFFMALLRLIYFFDLGNLETIQAARFLFACLGVACGGLLFLIVRADGGNHGRAVWTGLLFFTCSFFMVQGFRVRSDLPATFFQLVAIWFFLTGRHRAVPVAHTLMLLCTPKAALLLTLNLAFMFLRGASRRALTLAVAPVVAVFFLILLLGPSAYMSAAAYFFASFFEDGSHPAFFSAAAFHYVGVFFSENPIFVLLPPLMWLVRREGRKKSPRGLSLTAVLALTFVFVHNDRLPSFILSMAPFPILWLGAFSAPLWEPSRWRPVFSVLVAIVMIRPMSSLIERLQTGSNSLQRATLSRVEDFLRAHPKTVYYDGIVALPRENRYYLLPAPEHFGNRERVLDIVGAYDLDVVFFTNRLHHYLHEIYQILEDRYFIRIGDGVFARAYVVRDGQREWSSAQMKEVCRQLRSESRIHLYEGTGFLEMRSVDVTRFSWDCAEGARQTDQVQVISTEPFIGFSRFAPIELPEEKSFAKIYDTDDGN